MRFFFTAVFIVSGLFWACPLWASGVDGNASSASHELTQVFVWLALILILAKISNRIEKFGPPPVLGELVLGVILGNLALVGIDFFEPAKSNPIIHFLGELGVVILLFQIGLETKLSEMRRVGWRATLVATVGVVVPFVLGTFFIGPWILPGVSFNTYLFIGATLTATSVGITARIFKDMGRLRDPEAKIVLGAAVIDDVMGLIILAVVYAIVTTGSIGLLTIGGIVLKAVLFFVFTIAVGQYAAPPMNRLIARIHAGSDMKLIVLLGFCLFFAFLAERIGLAPIVGAFAAGLVLEPAHFGSFSGPQIIRDLETSLAGTEAGTKTQLKQVMDAHRERHMEDLLEPIGHVLVPIFFVTIGMSVDVRAFMDPKLLAVALGITVIAIIGKIVSGMVAGNVRKWIVGWGMVPRGEVGLIFVVIGRNLGVVSNDLFSMMVIMIVVTTFITPPILTYLLKRQSLSGS